MASPTKPAASAAASTAEALATTVGGSGALKAVDIQQLLRDRLAVLSGGRDRGGRPIVTFPSRESAERTPPTDIRLVLLYLHAIPDDESKDLGFVVLIDMRHGMTWATVKPILKTLQESFPGTINCVYIIKPDRFWEKQRASIASAKYKFEVTMISVDSLFKYIDASQLTHEFNGTLVYDHDEWIELRVSLEALIWRSLDILRSFETIRHDLEHCQLPVDVETAKAAIDGHLRQRKRISTAPVEEIEVQAQSLLQRLTANAADAEGSSTGGGDSDYGSAGRDAQLNPDFAAASPHVVSLIDNLRSTREQLFGAWQLHKQRLDQCFQLKLFEQDAEAMFQWIRQHVGLFLARYADIGDSHESAQAAHAEHEEFARAANHTFVNVAHIKDVAQRLLDSGHYAAPRIDALGARLQHEWRLFAKALDARAAVLALSVRFHLKASQYLANVADWEQLCASPDIGDAATSVAHLETSIHRHQQLMDDITQAYSEIHTTSKKLLFHLDLLVQLCVEAADSGEFTTSREGESLSQMLRRPPSLDVGTAFAHSELPTTPADYTAGANHVLALIHQMLGHQRALEKAWQTPRVRLHQRLALLLFEQDVRQVLDWLDNHGEHFLRKNCGIGKTLQRARALQKSQQHFENVAKNTYTNAEKLLAAAEELAGTGECRPEEVCGVAQQLQRRITTFAKHVQARRHLLNLSVLFHTHYKEIMSWYDQVEAEDEHVEVVSKSLNECEQRQESWLARTDATVQAYATAIGEGQQLMAMLRQQAAAESVDNTESCAAVETLLGDIERRQTRLADRWQAQRVALQLAAKYALFEQDCGTVGAQLDGWREDMRQMTASLTPAQAEKVQPLHQENTTQVHAAMLEITSLAHDLIQMLETSGLQLVTQDGRLVRDCIAGLAERVRQRERDVMQMAEKTGGRLEQALQLGRLQNLANQVVNWIKNEERVLAATLSIPASLEDAEQVQSEHREFQLAVEKTNQSAVALQEKAEQMLACDHYDPNRVRSLAEDVLARWRHLVTITEERHKLLTAACTYYKTLLQVVPVLDNLERDYEQSRDWCSVFSAQPANAHAPQDKVTFMAQLIDKHMGNKERFLRGCTYARKNSELFLKYVRRCAATAAAASQSVEQRILNILDQLRQRENHILQLWTKKKRQLDQCQQFVLLEASAKQVLDWLHEEAEVYFSTHPACDGARELLERQLAEHVSFKLIAKEHREKVHIFLGLGRDIVADGANGHRHSADIEQWMAAVQQRYTDFSQRMEKLERRLQALLGRPEPQQRDLALDRQSDPNLEAKIKEAAREFDESKRKSARRREFIMAELLKTERAYVDDLHACLAFYRDGLTKAALDAPACLRDKHLLIFSNLADIYDFHNKTFLKELQKYESLPESVGHCFVTWAQKFQLYVTYCKNKDQSNTLLGTPDAMKFFSAIQHKNKLSLQLQAYLIKPVQRITKYQLLLKDLRQTCADGGDTNEIADGLEVMLSVPRRANDVLHLSMLENSPRGEEMGDLLLQESFTVWEPRLIKKGRERHVFLFDLCILFSKKIPDAQPGKFRYVYKNRMMVSEINVTEHIEGDECKLAVWTGQVPNSEYRWTLKARDYNTKLDWVLKLRQLIGERMLNLVVPHLPTSFARQRQAHVAAGGATQVAGADASADRQSLHSYTSTVSSDVEAHGEVFVAAEDFTPESGGDGLIALRRGERVECIERSVSRPGWLLVRLLAESADAAVVCEGLVPAAVLRPLDDTLAADDSSTGSAAGIIKRKSFKRWFNPSSSSTREQRPAAQRQLSADPVCAADKPLPIDVSGGASNADVPIRRGAAAVHSTSSKPTVRSGHDSQSPAERPITPPLASEEDLQDNERVSSSSAKQTPLSGSPSFVLTEPTLSTAVSTSAVSESTLSAEPTDAWLPHDIHIPPPMDPLASVKLNMNGQQAAVDAATSQADAAQLLGRGAHLERIGTLRLDESSGSDASAPADCSRDDTLAPASPPATVTDLPSPVDAIGPEKSPEDQSREKRRYVLMELVETEKDYVRDLGSIVDGYIATINSVELPDDMQGKEKIIFANIQQILEFHKNTFLADIEKCLEDYNAAALAFIKHERRLHMYVKYCENKPKSEFLMQQDSFEAFFLEIKQKLGHKLSLADLLIKPVQRIMKYQLLLKDIHKYTERAGDSCDALVRASRVMHVVPKACDEMMQVGRLQGFDGNINAQGKLLLQATFVVSENPPDQPFKGKERRLFLFEQSVIVADCIAPKKQYTNPTYIYRSHILVNKMQFVDGAPEEPLRFTLRTNEAIAGQAFLVQACSDKEKSEWLTSVNRLLDAQQDFLRALQQPILYQTEKLTKEEQLVAAAPTTKKGKSPIINRLTALKGGGGGSKGPPSRTESCPAPPVLAGATQAAAAAGADDDTRKHSLEVAAAATAAVSPKNTRTKLFQFSLRPKQSGPKSPTSPPPMGK